MSDYQKLSSDLSRVTEFLLSGNDAMARKFSDLAISRYAKLPGKIGKDSLGGYLQKIASLEGGKMRAAERAMTASVILANYSP